MWWIEDKGRTREVWVVGYWVMTLVSSSHEKGLLHGSPPTSLYIECDQAVHCQAMDIQGTQAWYPGSRRAKWSPCKRSSRWSRVHGQVHVRSVVTADLQDLCRKVT